MIKNVSICFFLIPVLFFSSSCKKEKAPASGNSNGIGNGTIKSVFDYGYYMPGSYWIYQDSLSGNTDSVYVIYAIKGKDTADIGEGLKAYDRFEVKMHSSFEDYDYYLWFSATWSGSSVPYRHKLFYTKSKPGDYVGEIIVGEIPGIVGHTLDWCGSNVSTTQAVYSVFESNSISYSNVIKTHQSMDCIQSGQQSNYYMGKNMGIIRKEYLDSTRTWKLTRFNIVR